MRAHLILIVFTLGAAACGGGSAAGSSGEAPPPAPVARLDCPETPVTTATTMDLERMDGIVRDVGNAVERRGGVWQLELQGVPLTIVTDTRANRMRVVAPVARLTDLTPAHQEAVMLANFHTALDARYAVSGGILYSAFIHPLGSLTDEDLRSALRQTASLVVTFGSSYNSGELVFGTPQP